MDDLRLIFEPLPGEALSRFLTDNVTGANVARTGVSNWHPVGFFPRNGRGEWLGGVTGQIWGNWLHVTFPWVAEALRAQRHGSRLMDAAEAFAVERDASGATLETHSFGARDFYLRRGYTIFGHLENDPSSGHTTVYLRKTLPAQES